MNAMTHSTRLLLAGFAPEPLCLIRCVRWATALVLALAVAACGGGGSGGAPASTAVVASVMIRDTGLMLQQPGDSRQLSAVAKDAQGNELDVPITWTSSKAAALGVDASGKVTAASASGSSQIVATAQGVKSAPLLAVVMQPAPGTVLVSDAQILGEPVETDPNAAPSFANTYRVTLSGVAAPALGTLLVGTGSKAVAGRVVAVDTSLAGQTTVTLALVPLREMFPNLQIDEVIDLSRSPVTYSDAVLAAYTVERVANTFTFTPKPASAQGSSREQALANAVGTRRALGPFSCDSAITGLVGDSLPVQLTAPPLISITIGPSLDLRYTPTAGLERLVIKAEPTLKIASELTASIAFEGKLSCKLELFVFPIPIGGALSFVVGGLVPVGAGFELGGKITLASLKLTSNVEAKANAEIGVVCPGGTACALHTLLEPALKFDPKLTLPSAGLSGLRLEPTLEIFGTVDADFGSRLLRSLRWEVLKTKFGGKLAGSFATRDAQIADAGYKSDYKFSLEAKAGVGFDLHEALGALGLASLTVVERTISTDIATSPAATVTADRATFSVGDTVNLKAVLDPVTFLSLYNVNKIVWVRDSGGTRTTVGTQVASSGQTEFNFPFVADVNSDGTYYAFVVTALAPDFLELELGQVAVSGVSIAPPPPSGTCPSYTATAAEITVTSGDWLGVHSQYGSPVDYDNVALSYTANAVSRLRNQVSARAHNTSAAATATVFYTVDEALESGAPLSFVVSWVPYAEIEVGSVTATLTINNDSRTDTATGSRTMPLQIPVTAKHGDILRITATVTASSSSPAGFLKGANVLGTVGTGGNLIPNGLALVPVTCN